MRKPSAKTSIGVNTSVRVETDANKNKKQVNPTGLNSTKPFQAQRDKSNENRTYDRPIVDRKQVRPRKAFEAEEVQAQVKLFFIGV